MWFSTFIDANYASKGAKNSWDIGPMVLIKAFMEQIDVQMCVELIISSTILNV